MTSPTAPLRASPSPPPLLFEDSIFSPTPLPDALRCPICLSVKRDAIVLHNAGWRVQSPIPDPRPHDRPPLTPPTPRSSPNSPPVDTAGASRASNGTSRSTKSAPCAAKGPTWRSI